MARLIGYDSKLGDLEPGMSFGFTISGRQGVAVQELAKEGAPYAPQSLTKACRSQPH